MYGPPPDPRQVIAPVGILDDPWSHVACAVAGLALTLLGAAWKRPPATARAFLLALGQTVLLTAPLGAHLQEYVYGAFPTVDKEGSLLFYLDGVHRRVLLHPLASLDDPAARLIGVHVGHLWVTEAFDLVLSPIGAFNAQALLYPALAWYAAWLLLRDLCGDDRVAFVLSFAWGMGLHVFRDLNWYTIEKAAIFWLALYLWALARAAGRGGRWRWIAGGLFALMTWMNLYLGLVGAAVGALGLVALAARAALARTVTPALRSLAEALGASALFACPLVAWQAAVLARGPGLGGPEVFLWERAALDGFSLVPFRWNRLEVPLALNAVALGLALVGLVRSRTDPRVRFAAVASAVLWAISIGPVLLPGPVENPVYFAVRAVVPGFWRVAKPEVFFHGAWLLLLGVASVEVARTAPRRGGIALLYALVVGVWFATARTHPAFPGMTMPVASALSPGWEERVFGGGGR